MANNEPQTPSSGVVNQDDTNQLDDTNLTGEENQTDVAERSKGRNVQARFDEMTAANYELKQEVAELKEKVTLAAQAPKDDTPPPPNVQAAVSYLKNLGFTQKTDVDAEVEKRTRAIEDRMLLNTEHMRLENSFDGADGRPSYERSGVEKYMRDHGIFNPEAAYKTMHEAELLDWNLKKSGTPKQKPFVERPSASTTSRDDNTITLDKIDEWMKTPEGRMKYEQNRQTILQMMAEGKLQ